MNRLKAGFFACGVSVFLGLPAVAQEESAALEDVAMEQVLAEFAAQGVCGAELVPVNAATLPDGRISITCGAPTAFAPAAGSLAVAGGAAGLASLGFLLGGSTDGTEGTGSTSTTSTTSTN